VPNRRPKLELVAPGASPAEAAAIVAALERFMRETAHAGARRAAAEPVVPARPARVDRARTAPVLVKT
jgi:hypothetical protein